MKHEHWSRTVSLFVFSVFMSWLWHVGQEPAVIAALTLVVFTTGLRVMDLLENK